MKRLNILKSLVTIAIIVVTLSSCRFVSEKSELKGRNFICVVDFSSSKNSAERQEFYMNVIKNNIIRNLTMTDRITVIPIDKASVTNSSEILIADLSAKDFTPEMASPMEEDDLTKKNFKNYKDSLAIIFETSFKNAIADRTKQSQGTDLLGALENVKGYTKPVYDNYVIFLSDMMNYTSFLNMEPSNTNFTNASVDEILKKLPGIEMPNTTALVLTANQVDVSAQHFSLVNSFWAKYFSKNNIKLYDYSSASVSKLDELMTLPLSK